MIETIKNLADTCAELKTLADIADKKYKMAKSELEMLCEEHKLDDITTDKNTVHISHRQKFSKYSDDYKVLEAVPKTTAVLDFMSLDRKKINELIKEGVLPEDIKKFEKFTEYNAVTIKPLEE
jgi:hypothetical protein